MMTTTVFIDFGEGINGQILTTIGELRRELIGPDLAAITPLPDATRVALTPLRSIVQYRGTFAQPGFDYNDDGRVGDVNDYVQLRNDVVSIVRRQFEPFDINVEVVAARNTTDIRNIMLRNAGDFTGQFDAYVFAGGIVNPTTGVRFGPLQGWVGLASGVDFAQTRQNVTDEVAFLDGQGLLIDTFQVGFNAATALANVISHEAGHTFALQHTNDGSVLAGQLGTDQEQLAASDIVNQGGTAGAPHLRNVAFFTRYPLMRGDGNVDPNITWNQFEILANDPDIGLHNTGPRFVTGTGAFDRITITRADFDTAIVTVEPFRDETFNSGSRINIATGGMYSYVLTGITRGIVVEAGRGKDQIVIDAGLSVPITVRGGQGFDDLRINGLTVGTAPPMDALFAPDQTYRSVPGEELYSLPAGNNRRRFTSYSGTVIAGATQIRYDEFDDAGAVHFDNFASAKFNGSAGFDSLRINGTVAGTNEVEGTVSRAAFPNFRYSNVRSVVIDTGATIATDAVDINALTAPALAMLTVMTGPGNDFITVTTPTLQLANPQGVINLNFGDGTGDTLTAVSDVNWTLTDTTLRSGFGAAQANLLGLVGENAVLLGGAGSNTFEVSGWNGRGTLVGNGGLDTVSITRNANFTYGENFVNVTGGGSFSLGTMETLLLTGGQGPNTFIDQGWNGRGTIDGGPTLNDAGDMIATFRDSHVQLTDNSYVAGNNVFFASMTLTDVELASLTGGPSLNQFDLSLRTTPALVNGAGGFDIFVHTKDVNYLLTNSQLTISGSASNFFTLANMESVGLTGGGSANTFTISQWAGIGTLVGGAGDDVFNIAQGNLDAVAGSFVINAGLGNDQINLNDQLNGFATNYVVSPNNVLIAPGNSRRFGGIFQDGTAENLRLNATQAANRVDVTPSLITEFTIDGNAPSTFGDALVIHEAFTGPHQVPVTGGRVRFNSGHRDVVFLEIEQLIFTL
jgi:hypothetical protein